MPWRFWTTERVFTVSGILLILLGWYTDLVGILLGEVGGHGAGDILNRVWYTFLGLAFMTGGTVWEKPWRFLKDSKFTKRYLLVLLFMADGAFHLYAFNDHLSESVVELAFFAVVAPAQFAFGLLIPKLEPKHDPYVLAWPGLLLFLGVVSQFVPIWPLAGVENIYDLWVVSKLTELLTVLVLLSLMREEGVLNRVTFKQAALAVVGRSGGSALGAPRAAVQKDDPQDTQV